MKFTGCSCTIFINSSVCFVLVCILINHLSLQPFVEMCKKHGNRVEAGKYVPKVPLEKRFDLYMSIG